MCIGIKDKNVFYGNAEIAKNRKPDNKKPTRSPNGRPTIGFLNASGLQFFHLAWRGIADVAREQNINAISFVGQYVRDTRGFKAQANILYDLIDAEQLDGLVIQDLMCNLLDPDETRQFYERYRPLPIVSLGRQSMEGISYVQSSGYEGMRKAIVHLIEVHGRRRRPHGARRGTFSGFAATNTRCQAGPWLTITPCSSEKTWLPLCGTGSRDVEFKEDDAPND